ncbi:MAG: pyridoxamine 5'-phosphate oxidase family protein [Pseudomonadota bacterium]
MDSINKQQSEHNRADLQGAAAIERIKEMAEEQNCFFCTDIKSADSSGARPMNVLQVDADGNLWFLSARDSFKNLELQTNPEVKLYFQGSAHSDFLELRGYATVSTDKAKIKELWKPIIKTWFTEGIDDPRITVIKVAPVDGYYWDTKHGSAIAGIKMLIGATIGKTMDDSIEGKLRR